MIRYLLDTNFCVYLTQQQPMAVVERFSRYRRGELVVSTVTWAELCSGWGNYYASQQITDLRELLSPVPFDVDAAAWFGRLSQQYLQRRNTLDRMIAAHALALDVPLLTNTPADFQLYAPCGLRLENWTEPTL